jgi:hypothetical protein
VLASGVRIRVPADFDAAVLDRLLGAAAQHQRTQVTTRPTESGFTNADRRTDTARTSSRIGRVAGWRSWGLGSARGPSERGARASIAMLTLRPSANSSRKGGSPIKPRVLAGSNRSPTMGGPTARAVRLDRGPDLVCSIRRFQITSSLRVRGRRSRRSPAHLNREGSLEDRNAANEQTNGEIQPCGSSCDESREVVLFGHKQVARTCQQTTRDARRPSTNGLHEERR